MSPEKIRTIVRSLIANISNAAETVGDEFNQEATHKFRVAIKTLRSFLRLLRLHSYHKKLKVSAKAKRLYQIAGKIRDAQMELDRLNEDNIYVPFYKIKLLQSIDRQKVEWRKRYARKHFRKLAEKLEKFDYETLPPGALTSFFSTRIESAKELSLGHSPTDDQVHGARKKIKDIIYTSKIIKKKWHAVSHQVKQAHVKELDDLADLTGKYNDGRIALQHKVNFSSGKTTVEEEKTMNDVCESESARLIEEKQNLLGAWRQTMSKVQE